MAHTKNRACKNNALETALNRALWQAGRRKHKPSPEEYEKHVLEFLNALHRACKKDESL